MRSKPSHRHFRSAITLIHLVAVACVSEQGTSGTGDAGVQSEAGTLADANTPQVFPIPYPIPATANCNPQAPEAWSSTQRAFLESRLGTHRFGPPPPVDPACRFVVDRSCNTVCDCAFALSPVCGYTAIAKTSPWYGVAGISTGTNPAICTDTLTFCSGDKGLDSTDSLACIDGTCRRMHKGEVIVDDESVSPGIAMPEASLPASATMVCDPVNPPAYSDALYQRLLFGRGEISSADVGACDADCHPVIERACKSVCDCKFVLADCKVQGASRAQEGSYWDCDGPNTETLNGPSCKSLERCNHAFAPGTCKPTLACIGGQCVATPAAGSTPCTGP